MPEHPDTRPWVKLSVDYFDNFKIQQLTNDGMLLHLYLIVQAGKNLSDGVVPKRTCQAFGPKPFRELLDAGLLREESRGRYEIHDYRKHQTSRAKARGNPLKGAHTVHHTKRGIIDANCDYCLAEAAAKPLEDEGPPPF